MGAFYEDGQLTGENPSDAEAATAVADPEPEPAGEPAPPAAEREQPAPDPEPEPDRRTTTARRYVVLERVEFEDEQGTYWLELATVEARNGTNALRRAFKSKVRDDQLHHLVAVPATQWSPEPVKRSVRSVESVQIGA